MSPMVSDQSACIIRAVHAINPDGAYLLGGADGAGAHAYSQRICPCLYEAPSLCPCDYIACYDL